MFNKKGIYNSHSKFVDQIFIEILESCTFSRDIRKLVQELGKKIKSVGKKIKSMDGNPQLMYLVVHKTLLKFKFATHMDYVLADGGDPGTWSLVPGPWPTPITPLFNIYPKSPVLIVPSFLELWPIIKTRKKKKRSDLDHSWACLVVEKKGGLGQECSLLAK